MNSIDLVQGIARTGIMGNHWESGVASHSRSLLYFPFFYLNSRSKREYFLCPLNPKREILDILVPFSITPRQSEIRAGGTTNMTTGGGARSWRWVLRVQG